MGEIIQDGVILVVSEFAILLMFIVLSNPIALVLAGLANAGTSMGITQMAAEKTLIDTVLTICWILLGFIPIIWFIVRMMSREPDCGYRYY